MGFNDHIQQQLRFFRIGLGSLYCLQVQTKYDSSVKCCCSEFDCVSFTHVSLSQNYLQLCNMNIWSTDIT